MTTRRAFIQRTLMGAAVIPLATLCRATASFDAPSAVAPKVKGTPGPRQLTRKVGPLVACKPVDLRYDKLEGEPDGCVITLTRADGTKDVFLFRPSKGQTESPPPRIQSRPLCSTYRMAWHGISKLVDGREREVDSFDLSINIPRTDLNGQGSLDRIDEILFAPLDINASWREVSYV